MKGPPPVGVFSATPLAKTSEWHMLSHETTVPRVEPLPSVLHRISVPNETGAQHNPTVFVQNGTLRAVVRVLHGMRTTNYVGDIDGDWGLTNTKKIAYAQPQGPMYSQVEDLRVFEWQGGLWAIAAAHSGAAPPTAIRQALLQLNTDGSTIEKVHVQPASRHEKNWMPCVTDDGLRIVYSTDPLIVLQVAPSGGGTIPNGLTVPQSLGHVRGGSQLVPFEDGWLAIVHQVHRPPRNPAGHNSLISCFWSAPVVDPIAGDAPVVYIHRFAKFDARLGAATLGSPWIFKKFGIEFCCGLTAWGGGLVAAFGLADKEAWLAEIDVETVNRTFTT